MTFEISTRNCRHQVRACRCSLVHRFASICTAVALCTLICPPSASFGDVNVYEVGRDPGVGFNLVSWWNFGNNGNATWENAVQDVYDAGFREVSISPLRFVQINSGQNPGTIATISQRAPTLAHIEAGVVRAKSLGMRVTLNPFVELVNGSNHFPFWRGQYDPLPFSAESTRFWSGYHDYVVDVAAIAETHQVDALNVGTELRAIVRNSGNNPNWNSLIDAVDATYSGKLGYAANWDNFKNTNLTNTIWAHPAIDYIGIDSYFPNLLSNSAADNSGNLPNEAFISQVEAAWNARLDNDILAFAGLQKNGTGMPVEFTEVGYLPYNRTTVTPQNSGGSIDRDEQTMAFMGLMRALDGRADDFLATHIWQWGMPGSNGSLWNMNVTNADQPNNTQTTTWLSEFVSNAIFPADGDFNNDGAYDCADIDALVVAVTSGSVDPAFDLNGDGSLSTEDVSSWLAEAGANNLASGNAYLPGDATLDGIVDISDFNIWNANKFTAPAAWCRGDFNVDGNVDISDFNIWNARKFTSSDAAAVPEPVVGLWMLSLLFVFLRHANRFSRV